MTLPPVITDAFRASVASLILAASEMPPIDGAYSDEFLLIVPGGSLNGEASTGLTGAESAKGFCVDVGVAGLGVFSCPAVAPYGGGALACDIDLLTAAPAAVPPTAPPAMTWAILVG